jgi:SAM-dependent methyltransferase
MTTDRHTLEPASAWVLRFAPLVASDGAVLDVACGTGRHARWFLDRGHHVVAVDRYNAGIVDLLGRADFEFVDADLEDGGPWPLGDRRFASVVVTNYLHRPLIPVLIEALAPGGVLIYETFASGNERFGRPRNPDFLLRPGELLAAVEDRLHVVDFEHGEVAEPRPAMVQRIAAVNDHSAARGNPGGA